MNEFVYTASDGSAMNFEDFMAWILNNSDLTFDELTGGRDEFFSEEAYWKLRSHYEMRRNEILCN